MITVVDYDPSWPRRFEALRQEYADAFARAAVPVVAIEHVGSTSVPGLAAKPVIDCDIVIAEWDLAAATEVLTGRGFRPLGELGLSLRNHLGLRDTLRARPDLRDRYGALKQRVAETGATIEEVRPGQERADPADPGSGRPD